MSSEIYKTCVIQTIDGIELEISPLKIKYMREFMSLFNNIKNSKTEDETIAILCDCVRVCMKQFYPDFSKNVEDIEDNFDIKTIYKILEFAGGIKINAEKDEPVKNKALDSKEQSSWEDLDLVKLETEVFLLGIWKNFDELETSISMAELIAIISTRRELDYDEKRFSAAMQGIDLEKEMGNSDRGQKEWEDMKARVFSGGQATDSNDILALQGVNAEKVGFGIGMGLEYEDDR